MPEGRRLVWLAHCRLLAECSWHAVALGKLDVSVQRYNTGDAYRHAQKPSLNMTSLFLLITKLISKCLTEAAIKNPGTLIRQLTLIRSTVRRAVMIIFCKKTTTTTNI